MQKKLAQVARGFQYSYYFSTAKKGKPTLLLLHGWPDHAAAWEELANNYLLPRGYGVVLPDCLGYGDTSKPTDPRKYNPSGLSQDFWDLLAAEQIKKVIIGGHGWGAILAQRFYNIYPERCSGLITLNVPVTPKPAHPIIMDYLALAMVQSIGYFPGWYWCLLSDPVNGPLLLGQNVESLFDALHGQPGSWMRTLCSEDGLRDWLKHGKRCQVQDYVTEKMRQEFVARMSHNGFESPLCYYRALVTNIFYEQERKIPDSRYRINMPYLFIACALDVVCRPQEIITATYLGMTPYLTVEYLQAGHWCLLEKPKEVGNAFIRWLENYY